MSRAYKPICFDCSHLEAGSRTCKAFPKGIPVEITRGSNPHRAPLSGQDNDLIFDQVITECYIIYDSDVCSRCINYSGDLSCFAFPLGIPSKILSGEVSHDKPYPGQDFDTVFEHR